MQIDRRSPHTGWMAQRLPHNPVGGLKVVGLYAATRKPSGEAQNRNGSNFDGRALECNPVKCGHRVYWGPRTLRPLTMTALATIGGS